jgi:hypothetical protein
MTTALADRPGTEPYEIRTYKVLLDADRWDEDAGRITVTVRASGRLDARNQALELLRPTYPTACWLDSELVD